MTKLVRPPMWAEAERMYAKGVAAAKRDALSVLQDKSLTINSKGFVVKVDPARSPALKAVISFVLNDSLVRTGSDDDADRLVKAKLGVYVKLWKKAIPAYLLDEVATRWPRGGIKTWPALIGAVRNTVSESDDRFTVTSTDGTTVATFIGDGKVRLTYAGRTATPSVSKIGTVSHFGLRLTLGALFRGRCESAVVRQMQADADTYYAGMAVAASWNKKTGDDLDLDAVHEQGRNSVLSLSL